MQLAVDQLLSFSPERFQLELLPTLLSSDPHPASQLDPEQSASALEYFLEVEQPFLLLDGFVDFSGVLISLKNIGIRILIVVI